MNRAIDLLDLVVAALGRLGQILAGVILVAMTAYTLVEVILRNVFDSSTFVMAEFIGYGMAAMSFLALAETFRRGGMIRVNLALEVMGPRLRRAVELAVVLATLVLLGYLAQRFWLDIERNFRRGAVSESLSQMPLWIPPSLLLAGVVIFMLELLSYFVRLLAGRDILVDSGESVD